MKARNYDIASLKQAHRLENVIRSCGVALSPRGEMGERLQANCPFPNHRDSTPSFMVYRHTQTFRCFGCGIGGDVLDFLQHYYGWSFQQSLDYLAREMNPAPSSPPLPRQEIPVVKKSEGRRRTPDRGEQRIDYRQVLTLAVERYQEELFRRPDVLAYLDDRAISCETARHLCLGYSDGSTLRRQLDAHPLIRAEANAAGLLTSQGRERLATRLVIPEMRERQACYLIGRIVPPRKSRQKYLGIATTKCLLGYGEALRQIRQRERKVAGLLIVEGALDFVLAWQWQLPVCCVALLSTWASQFQLDEIADLYRPITGTPVLVFLDGDAPGVQSTPTLLGQLQHRGLPALAVPPIEEIKDIGELGKLPDGRERLLHTLMEAMSSWKVQRRTE